MRTEIKTQQAPPYLSKEKDYDSTQVALLGARTALEKKAENVKILELERCSSFTDYFVICSGTSTRQVRAIAEAVESTLSKHYDQTLLTSEGYGDGRWILLDFGGVIVHVFLDEVREYYRLESLWDKAPRIQIPSEFYGLATDRHPQL